MEKKFSGKVALITGATGGLGRGLVTVFAEKGADLILLDLNEEKLAEVKKTAEKYGVRAETVVCDIADEEQVNEKLSAAEKAFGKIDFLVNNAAIWRCRSAVIDTPTEEWRRFMEINVMGTVFVTRAVLSGMIERGYGKIVNVASVAGHYGNANMAHYSATKGAVIAFSAALSKEVIGQGINVNCVSPGTVSREAGEDIDVFHETSLCRLGRSGTARENAELIAFLCTDEARYIVGQNILIDGGRKSI